MKKKTGFLNTRNTQEKKKREEKEEEEANTQVLKKNKQHRNEG
jgi:hypothetical protein